MDTLTISPTNEKREDEEVVLPSLDLTSPADPPWWKEDDEDWNIEEMLRIDREMGTTGKCYFCDFSCEPAVTFYNVPLDAHQEEVHPETMKWFEYLNASIFTEALACTIPLEILQCQGLCVVGFAG